CVLCRVDKRVPGVQKCGHAVGPGLAQLGVEVGLQLRDLRRQGGGWHGGAGLRGSAGLGGGGDGCSTAEGGGAEREGSSARELLLGGVGHLAVLADVTSHALQNKPICT